MSVWRYIEETNPPEVRELLLAAHHFLRGNSAAVRHLRYQNGEFPFTFCAAAFVI